MTCILVLICRALGAPKFIEYQSLIRITPQSLLGLVSSPPRILSWGTDIFLIIVWQSSRLKVSPNLSSYEPYAGSVPKFLPCIKESVLQVHQSTRILPAVLRTAYVHFVFQQTKSCISMRKSSRCSLLDGEMRPLTPRYV